MRKEVVIFRSSLTAIIVGKKLAQYIVCNGWDGVGEENLISILHVPDLTSGILFGSCLPEDVLQKLEIKKIYFLINLFLCIKKI